MLKHFRLCTALFALSAGTLMANNHPSPGSWGITGEYLYLRPSVDETNFVISSPTTSEFPTGKREHNDFQFHSGYRVGGAYGFCECPSELQIEYTHLSAKDSKTVNGDFLWGTLGHANFASNFENFAGSASSRLNVLYQRVDANYAQSVFNCCGLDLYAQFGLEYASLRFREHFAYQSTILGTIHQRSKMWGIGPQLGFEFDYELYQFTDCLPGSLSLNVLSTGSLLVSKTRAREHNVLGETTFLDVHDHHTKRIIPALHTRIGLNYSTCISGFGALLEVGYEFSSYFRALSRTTFPDDVATGLSSTNYYNFDIQGLYVDAMITF